MGRRKRQERLPPFPSSHRPQRTFYFSIIAIFIGIPSGSLCGGEILYPIGTKSYPVKCKHGPRARNALENQPLQPGQLTSKA